MEHKVVVSKGFNWNTPNIKGRTVVVIEDITHTEDLEYINQQLLEEQPLRFIMPLLLKPNIYKKKIPIDFIGKEISNEFVVGYGLDYEELGRTFTQLYKLKKLIC